MDKNKKFTEKLKNMFTDKGMEKSFNDFLDVFFNENLSNGEVLEYVKEEMETYFEQGYIGHITGVISTAISEPSQGINPSCFNFGITLENKRMKNVYVPLDSCCLVNFSGDSDLKGKSLLFINFSDLEQKIILPDSDEKFSAFVRIK